MGGAIGGRPSWLSGATAAVASTEPECGGPRRSWRECEQLRATRATRGSVGLRSERGPILLAVMLSIGLVAIDSTILATAVPSVVSDLGGFTSFPWLFSIYLLAQAISVPLYGKLADLYGRKPLMLLGVGLFVARLVAVRHRVGDDGADRVPAGPGSRRRARSGRSG